MKKEEELLLSAKGLAELLESTLAKGAPLRFRAKGFSMSPFIKDGDTVTISPFFPSSIGFGSLVAFVQPRTGRLTIHRIVGKNANRYIIKGDNTLEPDNLISKEEILGCVTGLERNGKSISVGLGPARFLIAFLSRWYVLSPLMRVLRRSRNYLIKRSGHG